MHDLPTEGWTFGMHTFYVYAGGHHLRHGEEIGIFQGGVNFYNDGRVQGEAPVKVKILLTLHIGGDEP